MSKVLQTDMVIGIGEIGRPLADILGLSQAVIEKDVDPLEAPLPVGIMHICFPYSDSFVQQVVDYAAEYAPSGIIIHSTVVPGTTRAIGQKLKSSIGIAYSPVRGRHGYMHRDLMRYAKFVAAPNCYALDYAALALSNRHFCVRRMDPVEALELAKLLETTYSGVLIAWAQEMDRFCREAGAVLRDVLRFTDEVDYLPCHAFYPGEIGGHCIMQNLDMLDELRRSPFVDAVRESNEMVEEVGDVRHRPERLR